MWIQWCILYVYVTIVDLSSWQTKLEAPPKETVDGGLDSSNDEDSDEDLDTNNLQETASSAAVKPPCVFRYF